MNYDEMWNSLKEYIRYLNEDAFAFAEDEAGWVLQLILNKFDELESMH